MPPIRLDIHCADHIDCVSAMPVHLARAAAMAIAFMVLGEGHAQDVSLAFGELGDVPSDGVIDGNFMFGGEHSIRVEGCCRGAEPVLDSFPNMARKRDCRQLCVADWRCHACKYQNSGTCTVEPRTHGQTTIVSRGLPWSDHRPPPLLLSFVAHALIPSRSAWADRMSRQPMGGERFCSRR